MPKNIKPLSPEKGRSMMQLAWKYRREKGWSMSEAMKAARAEITGEAPRKSAKKPKTKQKGSPSASSDHSMFTF